MRKPIELIREGQIHVAELPLHQRPEAWRHFNSSHAHGLKFKGPVGRRARQFNRSLPDTIDPSAGQFFSHPAGPVYVLVQELYLASRQLCI